MRYRGLACLLCALAGPAGADDTPTPDVPGPVEDASTETVPRWEWGVALAGAHLRDYPGSSHRDSYALPLPWFIWRSDRVEVGREGGRGVLYRTAQRQLDFTLVANPPADNDDNPERAGMEPLDAVIEPGLRARMRFELDDAGRWRLDLRLPVRYALAIDDRLRTRGIGVHSEPGVSLDLKMTPQWSWGASASVGFAEAGYADYYYGVAPVDATAIRPVYAAQGGYTGWSVNTRVMLRRERLQTGVFVRYENIDGATFDNSPLVTTMHGLTLGLLASWRFGESSETLARPEP